MKNQQNHDFIVVNSQESSSSLRGAPNLFGKIILPPIVPVLFSAWIFLRCTVQKINVLKNEIHRKKLPNILNFEFNADKPIDGSKLSVHQISLLLNCDYEFQPSMTTVHDQTVFIDASTAQISNIDMNRDTFNFEVFGNP